MFTLIQANFLPRLGLTVGVFFTFVETAASPAENLVMLPTMLAAILFGVRGGLIGTAIGVLGISAIHVIAGTAPFTRLLYGNAPFDIAMLTAVSVMVGYGRHLAEMKIVATRRADTATRRLDQLGSESDVLSVLSTDIGKLLMVESILAAAGAAISKIVKYDRISMYQANLIRQTAKLSYVSGQKSPGDPSRDSPGAVFPLSEFMGLDPFDGVLAGIADSALDVQPDQILHRSIGDVTKPMAVIRIWSRSKQALTYSESVFVSSVTSLIIPALKRGSLQDKFEHAA